MVLATEVIFLDLDGFIQSGRPTGLHSSAIIDVPVCSINFIMSEDIFYKTPTSRMDTPAGPGWQDCVQIPDRQLNRDAK